MPTERPLPELHGPTRHLILYDGFCALCNWSVRFVAARDRAERFAFAPLRGATAADVFAHHRQPADLETMVLVLDAGTRHERLAVRSEGVLLACRELGPPWSLLAALRLVPAPLRDAAYRLVARYRYRVFGRYDSCPVPPAELRKRFLE
jgi:predicted DCC family thiol-disulfide oxidoreductase YuxK